MLQEEIPDRTDPKYRNIQDVMRLVEGVNSSLGKDIERYSFRLRDLDNTRFMATTIVFAIYALISIIILQVTIDDGTSSVASFFGESISKRLLTGVVLVSIGIPILGNLFSRSWRVSKSLQILRRHMYARIDFAEQVLTRVTTWEDKFKGDYYQKSILRLRITVLAQLIEEMQSISNIQDRKGIASAVLDNLRKN